MAALARAGAARTPMGLGDRRKEVLEQSCAVHAAGTRKELSLLN
jgi:hypothetical protein